MLRFTITKYTYTEVLHLLAKLHRCYHRKTKQIKDIVTTSSKCNKQKAKKESREESFLFFFSHSISFLLQSITGEHTTRRG